MAPPPPPSVRPRGRPALELGVRGLRALGPRGPRCGASGQELRPPSGAAVRRVAGTRPAARLPAGDAELFSGRDLGEPPSRPQRSARPAPSRESAGSGGPVPGARPWGRAVARRRRRALRSHGASLGARHLNSSGGLRG